MTLGAVDQHHAHVGAGRGADLLELGVLVRGQEGPRALDVLKLDHGHTPRTQAALRDLGRGLLNNVRATALRRFGDRARGLRRMRNRPSVPTP